jgi:hypothetical protein
MRNKKTLKKNKTVTNILELIKRPIDLLAEEVDYLRARLKVLTLCRGITFLIGNVIVYRQPPSSSKIKTSQQQNTNHGS